MSNATNLSKLANLLDDGTAGQVFVSEGGGNVAIGTLTTANVSEGVNLYFTDERVQTKLGSISGNVIPDTNVAYDLGSAAFSFKDLYLSGNTIRLGSLTLSDNGGALETTSVLNPGVSQAFATETYVDAQVAALVDSAPTTLDTLNELAAALGDDANFSTTIVAQLGTVSANTITNSTNINTVQANVTALPDSAANDHTTYTTLSGLIDTVQANVASISSTTLLGDLSDVSNTAPGDGQALVYSTSNTSWEPGTISGYTSSDFSTDFATKSTSNLSEGTNLYYTDARADARVAAAAAGALSVTYTPAIKYARLVFAATQSIGGNTNTILNFNTRSVDNSTSNLLTSILGDGKFIIPAGVTKVRLRASANGSSVTDQFLLKITKNGNNSVSTNIDIDSTGQDFAAAFTGIEEVVQGDYFQVSAFSQNARDVLAGNFTWFELEVIEGSILNTTVASTIELEHLSDVANTTPTDGQALIWSTSSNVWAPANVASSGGSTVSVSDTAPSSPSNGDQWFNSADGSMYVYYADGTSSQWVSVSGPAGSSVSVGTSPPSGAANGDQWFDSSSATLYVYYADGTSSQWVGVSGPRGPAGPSGAAGVSTGKAIAMAIVFG